MRGFWLYVWKLSATLAVLGEYFQSHLFKADTSTRHFVSLERYSAELQSHNAANIFGLLFIVVFHQTYLHKPRP